ncbi:hypothetical protein WJX74_005691 [Apatococcus lobatus]|uniref:F-box domain-containing protein n=1 Tax=Apatococcus lobatus TaxID=904363 RepID=A0AAW1Q5I9_9CHLO
MNRLPNLPEGVLAEIVTGLDLRTVWTLRAACRALPPVITRDFVLRSRAKRLGDRPVVVVRRFLAFRRGKARMWAVVQKEYGPLSRMPLVEQMFHEAYDVHINGFSTELLLDAVKPTCRFDLLCLLLYAVEMDPGPRHYLGPPLALACFRVATTFDRMHPQGVAELRARDPGTPWHKSLDWDTAEDQWDEDWSGEWLTHGLPARTLHMVLFVFTAHLLCDAIFPEDLHAICEIWGLVLDSDSSVDSDEF